MSIADVRIYEKQLQAETNAKFAAAPPTVENAEDVVAEQKINVVEDECATEAKETC